MTDTDTDLSSALRDAGIDPTAPDAAAKVRARFAAAPIVERVVADVGAHPNDPAAARVVRLGVTSAQLRRAMRWARDNGQIARELVPPRGRPRKPSPSPPAPVVFEGAAGRVAAACSARSWTQAQLARELGVSPGLVSAWMVGRRHPSAEMLEAIDKLAAV